MSASSDSSLYLAGEDPQAASHGGYHGHAGPGGRLGGEAGGSHHQTWAEGADRLGMDWIGMTIEEEYIEGHS